MHQQVTHFGFRDVDERKLGCRLSREISRVWHSHYVETFRRDAALPLPTHPILVESRSADRFYTARESAEIERPPDEEELRGIVFSMEKGKSPGVDGLPIEFFATFWDVIMVQLAEIVGFMWRSAIILDGISTGVITLIPKKMARARLED